MLCPHMNGLCSRAASASSRWPFFHSVCRGTAPWPHPARPGCQASGLRQSGKGRDRSDRPIFARIARMAFGSLSGDETPGPRFHDVRRGTAHPSEKSGSSLSGDKALAFGSLTERGGFEPPKPVSQFNGLANRRYRPLSHLSWSGKASRAISSMIFLSERTKAGAASQ